MQKLTKNFSESEVSQIFSFSSFAEMANDDEQRTTQSRRNDIAWRIYSVIYMGFGRNMARVCRQFLLDILNKANAKTRFLCAETLQIVCVAERNARMISRKGEFRFRASCIKHVSGNSGGKWSKSKRSTNVPWPERQMLVHFRISRRPRRKVSRESGKSARFEVFSFTCNSRAFINRGASSHLLFDSN